jgi:hypothetical protein
VQALLTLPAFPGAPKHLLFQQPLIGKDIKGKRPGRIRSRKEREAAVQSPLQTTPYPVDKQQETCNGLYCKLQVRLCTALAQAQEVSGNNFDRVNSFLSAIFRCRL